MHLLQLLHLLTHEGTQGRMAPLTDLHVCRGPIAATSSGSAHEPYRKKLEYMLTTSSSTTSMPEIAQHVRSTARIYGLKPASCLITLALFTLWPQAIVLNRLDDPQLYIHLGLNEPASWTLDADPGLGIPPLTMVGSIQDPPILSHDAPRVYVLTSARSYRVFTCCLSSLPTLANQTIQSLFTLSY